MTRTKAEVRAYLDSLVGKTCVDKSNSALNGQCVCMIKNLMEFLGVPNPYAARGHAKDVGNSYINQGIGTAGRGWLTVCVNRNMGGGYGHVWVDLYNESNYESNGATALKVTKNTRPVSQAQQFVNFDKWIKEEEMAVPDADNYYWRYGQKLALQVRGRELTRAEFRKYLVGQSDLRVVEILSDDAEANTAQHWQDVGKTAVKDRWDLQIYNLQDQVKALSSRPTKDELEAVKNQVTELAISLDAAKAESKVAQAERDKLAAEQTEDTQLLNEAGSWLQKLWKRLFK